MDFVLPFIEEGCHRTVNLFWTVVERKRTTSYLGFGEYPESFQHLAHSFFHGNDAKDPTNASKCLETVQYLVQ